MREHNVIQIKTNIKIVEEQQNPQLKERDLGYRDLNFFNEDINWANMLLSDVNTDEMCKFLPTSSWIFAKTMFC